MNGANDRLLSSDTRGVQQRPNNKVFFVSITTAIPLLTDLFSDHIYFLTAFWAALVTLPEPPLLFSTDLTTPTATV